jgi:hypothetical protein
MKRFAFLLIAGLFLVPAPSTPVNAADMGATPERVSTVHRYRHERRAYYAGCPDGYSCYPLYGAYGPYGGRSYWAGYASW